MIYRAKRQGIDKASTFRGFCDRHDRQLFRQIDNQAFQSTPGQAFLYEYRSLCRELFHKENSVNTLEKIIELHKTGAVQINHPEESEAVLAAKRHSMTELLDHKRLYDKCFRENAYDSMR